ncbi:MAG: hypothetical protein NTZ59_12405 [Bacteroidetes bacterium]|nr:hypothetical protein [Bacteroidota bacterium]
MHNKFKVVVCEQLNVNDDSYKVIELRFKNGEQVKKGDIVLCLDSSKASYDVHTDFDGYFFTTFHINDSISTNQPLFLITEQFSDQEVEIYSDVFKSSVKENITDEKNLTSTVITEKAKKIIKENNIDVSIFTEQLITEQTVKDYLKKNGSNDRKGLIELENANYDLRKRIAIIGAGQALIQLLDIIFDCNLQPVCVYDDTPEKQNKSYFGVPVKNKIDFTIIKKDYEGNLFDFVIISVGAPISFRKRVYDSLTQLNIPFTNLIHPKAQIGFNCKIGTGNIILPFVHIGPCSEIGNNNLISANCNLDHHNYLGNL